MDFTDPIFIAIVLGTIVKGLQGYVENLNNKPGTQDAQFDFVYFIQELVIPIVITAYALPGLAAFLGVAVVTPNLAFAAGASGKFVDEFVGTFIPKAPSTS